MKNTGKISLASSISTAKTPSKTTAKQIVMPAVLSALMLTSQIVLGFIPNVEIVTLIVVVSAALISPRAAILATLVFVTCEWLVYGFGYWVVSYYIYWPVLAASALPLRLIKNAAKKNIAAAVLATVMTVIFGIITAFVDALLTTEDINLATAFAIIYSRGIYFYVTHTVSNCIIVGALFTPLSRALKRAIRTHSSLH